MAERLSRDPAVRLAVFVDRGLIETLPTTWQLVQGQLEMAPYVVLPDPGDGSRYDGTLLGNPILRTPLIVSQIGLDHFRVGHGLHTSREAQYKHLNFVSHEGFPTYDLQLIQTMPDGLERFRSYTREIQEGATRHRRRQRALVDLVIPDAEAYRESFLEDGGWIDRAVAFDYPSEDEIEDFLRPEFSSLVHFMNHCARAYPARPGDTSLPGMPRHLTRLLLAKLGDARG